MEREHIIDFAVRPLKNGFAAAQKSFSLPVSMHILIINYEMLSPISERQKTFDSLLANHFSAVMQSSLFIKIALLAGDSTKRQADERFFTVRLLPALEHGGKFTGLGKWRGTKNDQFR